MLISICGKSGSGKSTISKELINIYKDKIVHLDIDKIGHLIYENSRVLKEVVECFGNDVLSSDKIDRKKLGKIVFRNVSEMENLTNITWKYMEEYIDKFLEDNKDKIILLDWLLLPKTKYFNLSDIRVLLDVPYEIRKERAKKRDNISDSDFELRDKAGINYDKSKFDLILKNNTKKEVRKLVKLL